MRYMCSLNEWLTRDVNDHQSEPCGITARIDQLRAELARHGISAGVIPVRFFNHYESYPADPPPAMPQPQVPAQPQQGPFVIPPVPPQAMAGPAPQPPFVMVNYPGVMPPVVSDPVLHVPVVLSPPLVGLSHG